MKEISVQELREILAKKEKHVAVIDVRTNEEHGAARIGGVENRPLDEIEKHADELRKFDTVYIHCQSGHRSGQACQRLEALGLANAVNVRGGIGEWERAGFEVCRGKGCRMPIMQQVLLSAGTLILSGFLLAILVHPYFLALPLIVGMGLTFAGATGKCFMMMALLRMPWNK
jgi:rhodanese-related sulfurtransferase